MVSLSTVFGVTAIAHSVCAAGVFVHARLRGREPGRWLPLTLLFGVFGVAGYLWTRR